MTIMEPNAPVAGENLALDLEKTTESAAAGMAEPPTEATTQPAEQAADPSAAAAPPAFEELPTMPATAEDAVRQVNGHDTAIEPAAPVAPIPGPVPFPLPRRQASGRYRSRPLGYQLELRVDVDGKRPLRKLSGDYYAISGSTVTYFGSWTVDAVKVTTTSSTITVVGTARTTWSTTFTVAKVTIPRAMIFQPAPPATLRWFTSSGAAGATYVCGWESAAFRTVELEQDCETGVTPFASYDTGSLTSGGAARTLSTAGAYDEAGVQMLDTGGANVINTPAGHQWTNASLHHAMQAHFTRWQERPQYKIWLLHARAHEYGTGLRGIMFDQQGLQRQGCASFYQMISSGSAQDKREQLYVNVHELGHCFNLYHSFHKSYMNPPLPNRPGSLSWMNYPQNYNPGSGAPGGPAAFWAAFPFQFDNLELAHLRHGFRNSVIMGGNPFGTGAALEVTDEYLDRVSDTSGLRLRIAPAQPRSLLGTPTVLEISLIAERTQQVHERDQLHPKFGFVHLAISRPRGDVVAHQPPVRHCVDPELVLSGHDAKLPVSAYIGYDAGVGQIFEDPGTYRIRASYAAPDGTIIVSNTATVRVVAPRTRADEEVGELLLGEQAGMALTLLGSDSPYLAEGTDALETVVAAHAEHPSAVYAQLALGMNAARPFTDVDAAGNVNVRGRDLVRADALLGAAIDSSRGSEGLDDLTVYQAMDYLASSHAAEGDDTTARAMRDDAAQLAESKNEPDSVRRSLEE
ncbi:MAG: hypothetical protein GEU86_00565 [Actinophytocola sp.]|nr:hypothetical protein [Actinophytocola sp.]